MKRILLITGLMIMVVMGCTINRGTDVKVTRINRGQLIVTVSSTCTVRSNNEAKLTTVGSGKVSRILVKENQAVEKETLLLELDSANQLDKDYKRMANLGEKGFVSSQQVELAKEQWKNTVIIAPFAGSIAKKFVEVGETLIGGMPAFLLADLTDMIVESNIDETDIGEVKVGQSAEVVLDAYKNVKLSGRVQFIAKSSLEVKEKGITYQVKVKLEPTNLVLRLGMTGDVNIRIDEKQNVLMTPYTSVGDDKDGRFVYAVENKKLKKKYIKTGLENYDNFEVLSGLSENEIVVENNISKLKEGQKVHPKEK